jgi:hypothetical protein
LMENAFSSRLMKCFKGPLDIALIGWGSWSRACCTVYSITLSPVLLSNPRMCGCWN